MDIVYLYGLLSVLIVSIISFIGLFTLSLQEKKVKKYILYMVSFAAGALLGDAFIHLLPESIEEAGFTIIISTSLLIGIVFSFIIEAFIHWRHCHIPPSKKHIHSFAIMNLIGDGIHNLLDGIIIATSYLVSVPVGIATTIAVIFHEIPQEIGDFAVLIHGGFSKTKALLLNFCTALTAVLGLILTFILAKNIEGLTIFLIPFAAGGFIYIACSDLIPELHRNRESESGKAFLRLVFFILGMIAMYLLIFLE
ncbi:MAG TPA: ZIP family metal transporter [Nanoarchaeota archaeon]|nr:ZIP family metal transporter [Candidatus Woesearchaeota archaeon]HIH14680.1 ZIP family metal transporter [Nanoarchaeota archaeon]HIH58698.1 ZIP family metal transporter [Nanoarchaeota archaeon]HII14325.1 ZIP family metal transporter [Nanoarchaeota archaeon]HIJ04891.1 ZIP family metal transporter [Nanoarchaeota archaeon]